MRPLPTPSAPGGLQLPPPSPDHLDRIQRLTSPLAWVALAALGAALFAALVWSVLATVPVKVSAPGILLPTGGVFDVSAPAPGRMAEVLVKLGDTVRQGQVVARLLQPEAEHQIARADDEIGALQAERRQRVAFLAKEEQAWQRLAQSQRQGALQRISALRQRVATLNDHAQDLKALLERGHAPRERVTNAIAEASNAAKELADAESSLVQLDAQAQERRMRAGRELLELDGRVAGARQRLAQLRADQAVRTEVRAPLDGTVVEEAFDPGDLVPAGAAVVRLLPGMADVRGSAVQAVVFVPAVDGKKFRPGTAAEVMPTVASRQRDGFIRGEVLQASELPASREQMTQILRNPRLVEQLSAQGAPHVAYVRLQRDPGTASGFAWSTGRGPDQVVDVGTLVQVDVVVKRVRVLALVVPQIDGVLRAVGL